MTIPTLMDAHKAAVERMATEMRKAAMTDATHENLARAALRTLMEGE